jgi:hypothetical protein
VHCDKLDHTHRYTRVPGCEAVLRIVLAAKPIGDQPASRRVRVAFDKPRSGWPAQRLAHQPPRAHHHNCQKAFDLAREAVGCMGVFGAPVDHGRVAARMH